MTRHQDDELLLRNGTLLDGARVDLLIRDGMVVEVGSDLPIPDTTDARPVIVELGGDLLLGAFVEPHLHLDKVFTHARTGAGGTLLGAMTAYQQLLATPTDDVIRRARQAVAVLVSNGVTAARVHIGCGRMAGTRFIDAIGVVRDQAAELIDLEIVAHIGGPAPGVGWPAHTDLLRAALDAGADVVGGNPSLEQQPEAALDALLQVATDRSVPVDLHLDETMDPSVFLLRRLAERAPDSIPVAASHCVSLGQQPAPLIAEVIEQLADKNIRLVTLPSTNLHLQGTGNRLGALPPLRQLLAAGVEVAAGSDNVQDPFNPTGRLDPLETSALLMLVAGLSANPALRMVTDAGRVVLNRPAAGPTVGAVADLVALPRPAAGSAIVAAGSARRVWRRGRLVAETQYTVGGPVASWSEETDVGRAQPSEETGRP